MELSTSPAMKAKRAKPTMMTSKGPLFLIFCNVAIVLFIVFSDYFRFKRTKIQKSWQIRVFLQLNFAQSVIFRRTSSIFVVVLFTILNEKCPNRTISFSFGKLWYWWRMSPLTVM